MKKDCQPKAGGCEVKKQIGERAGCNSHKAEEQQNNPETERKVEKKQKRQSRNKTDNIRLIKTDPNQTQVGVIQ